MKRYCLFILLLVIVANAHGIDRRKYSKLLGSSSASTASLVPYWYDGISVGNFDSSANWQELSGITTANRSGNEAYLWIISDAAANMLAAVSSSNASNQGVWTLQTPPTYVDWEDIESAVVGGQPYLYIFDYGNNGNGVDSRGTGIDMRIFRAKEPLVNGTGGTISSSDYIQINAAFPAGNTPTHRDCEGSIIDPDNGDIYVITKREAVPSVYRLAHQESYSGTQTLTYLGAMFDIPDVTTSALGATAVNVVDAAISPNGKEILVKNYNDIYYFPRDKNSQSIYQALTQTGTIVPAYVGGGSVSPKKSHPSQEPQGEGITYSKDGRDLYSNSEFLSAEGSTASRYPLFKYVRAPKTPITISFQDGVSPTGAYAGTIDTYLWGTTPDTTRGTETTFVLDITVGTPTDDRRTLLKFDLTSIPTNATVVGATLEFWISAEGQGWAWYRMLAPWNESSTYNTMTGGVDNDGVEAAATPSLVNGVNLDTILSVTVRDNILVSDVQSMVSNPSTNYGWLGKNLDTATGDGVQFDSRESITATRRPKLTVRYTL
jgi:hypothetical protein